MFRAFVLDMFLNLGQEYEISSNRELGYCRHYVLVLPRDDRTRPAILMELKGIAGFYREDPEKAMKEAIEQVNARGYELELSCKGI